MDPSGGKEGTCSETEDILFMKITLKTTKISLLVRP